MFRITQNRYGQLHETEVNQARNAKKMGMISFFEFDTDNGIFCTHSFFVPNPMVFQRNGEATAKLCLFKGRNDEIFFFNREEIVSSEAEIDYDMHLQIIQPEINNRNGEMSRDVSENCHSFRINNRSGLFENIDKSKPVMVQYINVHMLNSIPNLIEEGGNRYIVYNHESEKLEGYQRGGLSMYFYNVDQARDVFVIPGAEVFIDYFSHPEAESGDGDGAGRVIYLANKDHMVRDMWNKGSENTVYNPQHYTRSNDSDFACIIVLNIHLKTWDQMEEM